MNILAAVLPELVAEVASALSAHGRGDLVPQLEAATIERYTYDPSVDAGHIYLVRPRPSAHFEKLAAPVAETIPFMEAGINVDVDHDGNLFGIELLGRSEVFARLRDANHLFGNTVSMRLEDVHLHDAMIMRVIERPAQSVLAFELDYPEDWDDEVYVPKTLIFRDPLDYRVEEGPFHGSPTLLDANIDSKGGRFAVVLQTNAGRRTLSYSSVELVDGHDVV